MQLEAILFFIMTAMICFWSDWKKAGFLILCFVFCMAVFGMPFPFAILIIAFLALLIRD